MDNEPFPFDLAELQILRAFYAAWEEFHGTPHDKLHKPQKQQAAELMVQQAMILRAMKNPAGSDKSVSLVLNAH